MGIGLRENVVLAAAHYHFVIDVSGNMQRVDAKKERIAVLEQFINDLPEGSQAGIWTYASQVNNLLPAGTVDATWKEKAKRAVKSLNGYGPYANLPAALSDATYAWRTGKKVEANLILLTDNGVKNSDNVQQNQSATEQLANNLIPQLQKSGVKVYVVAFKDADSKILQQLATDTQGSFQQLNSSAELNSAFTQLQVSLGIKENNAVEEAVMTESAVDTPVTTTSTIETAAEGELITPETFTTTSGSTSGTEAVTNINTAPGLGEAEADEIRAALAKAETELQDLLNEYAATSQNSGSPAAALSGQQLSEPLVITLNDGSVLVTPDQTKANAVTKTPPSTPIKSEDIAGDNHTASAVADAHHEEVTEPEVIPPADWTSATQSADIWPLVLTILAIINIVIIIVLIMGRYLWLRHKRKNNNKELLKDSGSV